MSFSLFIKILMMFGIWSIFKNAIKEEPQSYIEVSEEEFDYDLEEFLIEEKIDEDYKVVVTDTLAAPKTDSLEIINE